MGYWRDLGHASPNLKKFSLNYSNWSVALLAYRIYLRLSDCILNLFAAYSCLLIKKCEVMLSVSEAILLKLNWQLKILIMPNQINLLFNLPHIHGRPVAWPSGLRRWFKAPVSSEAWVRIPPLPLIFLLSAFFFFCYFWLFFSSLYGFSKITFGKMSQNSNKTFRSNTMCPATFSLGVLRRGGRGINR